MHPYRRYDTALHTNTLGAMEAAAFAAGCPRLVAHVHVSTCYVNGTRRGVAREKPLPPFLSLTAEQLAVAAGQLQGWSEGDEEGVEGGTEPLVGTLPRGRSCGSSGQSSSGGHQWGKLDQQRGSQGGSGAGPRLMAQPSPGGEGGELEWKEGWHISVSHELGLVASLAASASAATAAQGPGAARPGQSSNRSSRGINLTAHQSWTERLKTLGLGSWRSSSVGMGSIAGKKELGGVNEGCGNGSGYNSDAGLRGRDGLDHVSSQASLSSLQPSPSGSSGSMSMSMGSLEASSRSMSLSAEAPSNAVGPQDSFTEGPQQGRAICRPSNSSNCSVACGTAPATSAGDASGSPAKGKRTIDWGSSMRELGMQRAQLHGWQDTCECLGGVSRGMKPSACR